MSTAASGNPKWPADARPAARHAARARPPSERSQNSGPEKSGMLGPRKNFVRGPIRAAGMA
jgi:hypothetical protein